MAEKTTTNKENLSDDSQVVENTQNQEQTNPDQFLKDFNWHTYEEGIDPVADEKLDEFEKLVAENFVETLDDQVVEGTVIHMTDRDAIIDINAKSEGVISLNEFRYNPNLKIGDKVEVLIDVREDATGQLILSHRKARVIKAWDRVISANETGEIVNGFIKCRTKGGMIVDVFGIEAFLPGSQIDVKPIRDYDQYVNKTMEFKVVKINHEFKNVVEYEDVESAQYIMIAPKLLSVEDNYKKFNNSKSKKGKNMINRYGDNRFVRYTHCELHQWLMTGTLVSNIPFANCWISHCAPS